MVGVSWCSFSNLNFFLVWVSHYNTSVYFKLVLKRRHKLGILKQTGGGFRIFRTGAYYVFI